jgi:hypothetical protein
MDPVFANAVTFAGTDMSDGCRSGVSCKGIRNRNHGTDITPKECSTGAGYAVLAHSQRGGRTAAAALPSSVFAECQGQAFIHRHAGSHLEAHSFQMNTVAAGPGALGADHDLA